MDVITFPVYLETTSGLSILLQGVISLPGNVMTSNLFVLCTNVKNNLLSFIEGGAWYNYAWRKGLKHNDRNINMNVSLYHFFDGCLSSFDRMDGFTPFLGFICDLVCARVKSDWAFLKGFFGLTLLDFDLLLAGLALISSAASSLSSVT